MLCTNTVTLIDHTGDILRRPDIHPVLHRVGSSLRAAGLYASALTHQLSLAHHAERLLGADHPDTLTARVNLATSYRQAGRVQEAIPMQEQVATDSERLPPAGRRGFTPTGLTARLAVRWAEAHQHLQTADGGPPNAE